MVLPKKSIRRIMGIAISEEDEFNNIQSEAVDYMIEKVEEFITRLTQNSIQFAKNSKRITLFKQDIETCLDSVSLVLKNIPKK